MKLQCKLVSQQELTEAEKTILHYMGKEFCFFYFDGVLKINKALPEPDNLAKIAQAMWQHDDLLEEPEMQEIEVLYKRVREMTNQEAADQLYSAWSAAREKYLKQKYRKAASEWLSSHNILDELDDISDRYGAFNPGFIEALRCLAGSVDAVFLYGFQIGVEITRTEATRTANAGA